MGKIERNGRTIRSVNIAFDILEKLQNRNNAGVTELAQELDHSKSTIHSHLKTLENRDILVREEGRYRLSVRILDIASNVRNQFSNYDVINSEVKSLADETGEIANFGIRERDKVVYLSKELGDQAVESASSVGTCQSLHTTALGKAILAYMPRKKSDEIISKIDFERRTPNSITSNREFREELEKIAERGYAIDDEENVVGLRCVASPVRNQNKVLGAVSLAGPSSRFTEEQLHGDISDIIKRSSNIIELNTKFS